MAETATLEGLVVVWICLKDRTGVERCSLQCASQEGVWECRRLCSPRGGILVVRGRR